MMPESIAIGLAWFLAWLFGQAAYHKFSAPDYYRQLIHRYAAVLPASSAIVMGVALAEAAIALSLLLPEFRAAGLLVAAALLLMYAVLMAREILRGRAGAQCGCAGPGSQLGISWGLVLRNGVCAALALLCLGTGGTADAGWLGLLLAGFVAMFTALVYLTAEQVMSNAQWMAEEA